jgi:multidrug efflux system outer membrane protein
VPHATAAGASRWPRCRLPRAAKADLTTPPSTAGRRRRHVAAAADWWTSYGDAQLDALVDEALATTATWRAVARIDQSRAALKLAHAGRLPSVDAGVSAARSASAENGLPSWAASRRTSATFAQRWTLPTKSTCWSRLARTEDAARDELLASAYARYTLQIALAAQVVQAVRGAAGAGCADGGVSNGPVQAQREGLRLQRLRFDAGDIGELDIGSWRPSCSSTRTSCPGSTARAGEAERGLALVLGRRAQGGGGGRCARAGHAGRPGAASTGLPDALPSDLLQRRPDVRAAEARLRAAGARVDAARAAYFPSITLTAEFGRESLALSRLADAPRRSGAWWPRSRSRSGTEGDWTRRATWHARASARPSSTTATRWPPPSRKCATRWWRAAKPRTA